MKSAGGDEQHVGCVHHTVFGVHRGSFHNGKNIPLHPFPGDIHPGPSFLDGDFIDFINKNDPHVFRPCPGDLIDLVGVNEFFHLLRQKNFPGFPDGDLFLLFLLAEKPSQAAHIDSHLFDVAPGENLHGGHAGLTDLHFHGPVVQHASAKHIPEFVPGLGFF